MGQFANWGDASVTRQSVALRPACSQPRALRMIVCAVATAFACLTPLASQAQTQSGAVVEDVVGAVRHVQVTLNKSKTLKVDTPFGKAIVGQPEIADVLPVTDSTIYIQGKKVGTTNISVFDLKNKLIAVIDLEIVPDTGGLAGKILASTGGHGIKVTSNNGQVILSGEASDAIAAARAVDVAKGLSPDAPIVNAMRVSPSQQVMLNVRILEADRSAGRDLGVNWRLGGGRVRGSTGPGTANQNCSTLGGCVIPGTPPQSVGYGTNVSATGVVNGTQSASAVGTLIGTAAGSAPFGTLLANVVNTRGLSIDTLLSALESRGLVKSLAEPDLIALSGVKASFHAGADIPVPTVQPGTAGAVPQVSIQYEPCGVDLAFTPTVLNDGLINLQLQPSVCEISTQSSVQIDGTTVPQLNTRKADTTVELRDGQSFAIAGLLQASSIEDISQVPYIGSIPILGALFRSTSFQKQETDLVVIVTPHLVKPAAPGQHLATPFDTTLQANDVDLFLMGDLERKKKFTDYVTSGGDLKGPYGHILQGR